METFALYLQVLTGIILHTSFCQASPIVRREAACHVNTPSAVDHPGSMPNWQIPGECAISIMETQTTHCLWCDELSFTTVLSNATYCCPAYRYCTEENQERIKCDGFWDTSIEFKTLADDQQTFQANLIDIAKDAKHHFDEITAIATVTTDLPQILAELNKTTENFSMILEVLGTVVRGR